MNHSQKKEDLAQPPILFDQTQGLIQRLEKILDGPVVAYSASVSEDLVRFVNEILRRIGPTERLFLYITTGGGDGQIALRLVHLLREYAGRLIALLPIHCASAGTMLVLGCEEIRMGPLAHLTAVDTSLTHSLSPVDQNNSLVSVSQDELMRSIRVWGKQIQDHPKDAFATLYKYVHPLVIGALDRASSLSIRICQEILSYHCEDEEKVERISRQLNEDYPSHGYPITAKEARRIGLNIVSLEPAAGELLLDLAGVYAEINKRCITDYDERNYHDNHIGAIVETSGMQIFYRFDKDWHYREQERRWVPLNDESRWISITRNEQGEQLETVLYV